MSQLRIVFEEESGMEWPHGQWSRSLYLSISPTDWVYVPNVDREYALKNPVNFYSRQVGVSCIDVMKYIRDCGVLYCCARTRDGDQCKNRVGRHDYSHDGGVKKWVKDKNSGLVCHCH